MSEANGLNKYARSRSLCFVLKQLHP